MNDALPILEYDPTPKAIIEPGQMVEPLDGMPEHGVICFFQDVIDLAGEVWDSRGWYEHWTVHEKLVVLAAEACLLL